jgi:fatty acid desaturase
MTKEEFFKSNYFKILLAIIIIVLIIAIWRNGYAFGQWLHGILN